MVFCLYKMKLRSLFHHRSACCGFPVENGCLVFAIVNAMIVSWILGECLYFLVWLMNIQHEYKLYLIADSAEYISNVVYGVGLSVCVGICFVFAVLLCYGVLKRRPGYVKSYFIFGVIVELFGVVHTLAFISGKNHDQEQRIASIVALIICSVYPFVLVLVGRTYVVFRNEAFNAQQKLITQYTEYRD